MTEINQDRAANTQATESSGTPVSLTDSNIVVLNALEAFRKTLNDGLDSLNAEKTNMNSLKDILKKIITANLNTTTSLQQYISDMSDAQTEMAKKLKDSAKSSKANTEALNLAHIAHVEQKTRELKTSAEKAKLSVVVHKFKVPTEMKNPTSIRKYIREITSEMNAPKHTVTLMNNVPKDNYIPVLFECQDLESRTDLSDCLKNAGYRTSIYNTPILHSFISKARKLYMTANISKPDIQPDQRHILIKTNFACDKLVVLIKHASDEKWSLLETLQLPIPKKWVNDYIKQTCSSNLVNLESVLPNEF